MNDFPGMRLIFLGTGTSFGVPQIGCDCAVCRSNDPRDRRTRSSAVIEVGGREQVTRLLIDTAPELRLQLVAAGIGNVDAVLYTHEHADHVHGIDDLRAVTARNRLPLPVFGDKATLESLRSRFRYIFDSDVNVTPGTTRPEGSLVEIFPGVPFEVNDVQVVPFHVPHGRGSVTAFRIGDIGYVTDAQRLPPEAIKALEGVKVLVLNALLRKPHPTHLSISEAVAVAAEVGAERTYFTHLTHNNSHASLAAELPSGVSPAYDGLIVEVPGGGKSWQ